MTRNARRISTRTDDPTGPAEGKHHEEITRASIAEEMRPLFKLKVVRICSAIAAAALGAALAGAGWATAEAEHAPKSRGSEVNEAPIPKPPGAVELERWRNMIVHTKRPKKACRTAEYHTTTWTETQCTTPPNLCSL